MTMTASDLSRPFILNVGADGNVKIRERGKDRANLSAGLPVFSTATREQAETLRVRHCKLARDGSGVYFLNDPPKNVEDLGRISDLFRSTYEVTEARKHSML